MLLPFEVQCLRLYLQKQLLNEPLRLGTCLQVPLRSCLIILRLAVLAPHHERTEEYHF
jgi:hypothetical protein